MKRRDMDGVVQVPCQGVPRVGLRKVLTALTSFIGVTFYLKQTLEIFVKVPFSYYPNKIEFLGWSQ